MEILLNMDGSFVLLVEKMSKTKVVNIRTYKGDYIPIFRGTQWGNPFKEGVDGTRDEVCDKYEVYIRNNPILLAELPKLEGETLGCYCKPKRCHGDMLVKLLEERRK